MKKAYLFYGGWDGHHPEAFATLCKEMLQQHEVEVTLSDSLEGLDDLHELKTYDVIIPMWTVGELTEKQTQNLLTAVAEGTGLAGFHGGMGDAFRGNIEYEWAVGGMFVGHPHVGNYDVRLKIPHNATGELPQGFTYHSEQYYMLVDPAINVHADTLYTHNGEVVEMPVIWTKLYGQGKVFYSALGHEPQEFETFPLVRDMTIKGILWAMRH